MTKLMLLGILITSCFSKQNFDDLLKEGIKPENLKKCALKADELANYRKSIPNKNGDNLFINFKMLQSKAKEQGYNDLDSINMTKEEAKAYEVRNQYLDYVNKYANYTTECLYTSIASLIITKDEEHENLYNSFYSNLDFIEYISNSLYKNNGINKNVYDSHIKFVNDFKNVYLKFK